MKYGDVDNLSGRGETTHLSLIDKDLNSASVTTTNGEGCGYIIPGTGIMLNNMLGEADLNPLGFHRWTHPMRLPTMISPTIIMKDKHPYVLLGSGGSNRIRSAIIQVIIKYINHDIDLRDAVWSPRIHLEGNDLYFEPGIEILLNDIYHEFANTEFGPFKTSAKAGKNFGELKDLLIKY